MINIKFEGIEYKQFETSDEANAWGIKYYSDIILNPNNKNYDSVLRYIGSMAKKWNNVMRKHPAIQSGLFENSANSEFSSDGEQIRRINEVYSVTKNNVIPENIILHRFTKKQNIEFLLNKKRIRKDTIYSDKAFTSTTLVKDLLVNFYKKNEYNCILKLYIPKGINGAYISLKDTRVTLDEQEVLLMPGTKFKIIKIHYFTSPMLIECKALLPEKQIGNAQKTSPQ